MICQFSVREGDGLIAGAGEVLVDGLKHPRGGTSSGKTTCGRRRTPPEAMPLSARASCMGVDGDGSLADADGDDLACVPLLMLGLQLPGGGGHGAGDLVGQVDAGLLADANGGGVLRDGVDAEPVGEGVVEGVAGVGDGVVDVDRAVVACRRRRSGRRMSAPPLQPTCMVWATFSCRPASDMMILKVLPGASCAWMALFSSGWSGLLRISFQ